MDPSGGLRPLDPTKAKANPTPRPPSSRADRSDYGPFEPADRVSQSPADWYDADAISYHGHNDAADARSSAAHTRIRAVADRP